MTYGISLNNNNDNSDMMPSTSSDDDFFHGINWRTQSSPSDFEVDDDHDATMVSQSVLLYHLS